MIQLTLALGLILTCLSLPIAHADEKPDGPVKKYFDSGKLSSEWTVKDGKENGPAKSYYGNGKIQEEWIYKDGKREGPAKDYYKYGELKAEYTYKNDKEEGPVTVYWENGKVMRVGAYKDGQRDGMWKDLYGDGRVESEHFFKNGKEDGTTKTYYESGKLKGSFFYNDGKLMGSKELWSPGRIRKECDYTIAKKEDQCKEYLGTSPQELIDQIEKKLAAIKDISYTLSTSFRPHSDANAAWTETLRTSHWYKAPGLAREDAIRFNLPGKPESHWIFKKEDDSLVAYEIVKDGSVVKSVYPAAAWEGVGPPNNLISDLKRRMAGTIRTVIYDYNRKVYIIEFNSPDQCTYEISDETGLPLTDTFFSFDKAFTEDGTRIVRVQMTDIKINTGMAEDVFRVPDQANTAQAAVPAKFGK